MTLKTKVLIAVVALLAAFTTGRYSVQVPEVKTVVDTNMTKDSELNKDTHKDTVSVTIKSPDGTMKTTIHTVQDTDVKKQVDTTIAQHIEQTVTPPKLNTLNVSAIAGIDFRTYQPVYGASITKEFIGPVTIGFVGLTNGVLGATVGLNF